MAELAIPFVLPPIQDQDLEELKYINLLTALLERRKRVSFVKSWPISAIVDLTVGCNLHCPYCTTGNNSIGRNRQLMNREMYDKIFGQLSRDLFACWYFSTGEPLLNKQIGTFLRSTKSQEIFSIISTNLSMPLSDERVEDILTCGLGIIAISLDGATSQTYQKYRQGGNFDLVVENMSRLVQKKKELGIQYPMIEWRFLRFQHNQHEYEKAIAMASEIGVDLLEFWPGSAAPADADESKVRVATRNMDTPILGPAYTWGLSREERPLQRWIRHAAGFTELNPVITPENKKCDWLYFSTMIYPDGAVGPCCASDHSMNDFTSLQDHPNFNQAWNSEKHQRSRQIATNEEQAGSICDHCPLPPSQTYQFRNMLRGILRNAPAWVIKTLNQNPDLFFFDTDRRISPAEIGTLFDTSLPVDGSTSDIASKIRRNRDRFPADFHEVDFLAGLLDDAGSFVPRASKEPSLSTEAVEEKSAVNESYAAQMTAWPEEVIDLVGIANEHFVNGSYPSAIETIGQALEILPDDPQLLTTRGNLLLVQGLESARKEFLKASILYPDYAPAHSNLAGVLMMMGRKEEAQIELQIAYQLDPQNAEISRMISGG